MARTSSARSQRAPGVREQYDSTKGGATSERPHGDPVPHGREWPRLETELEGSRPGPLRALLARVRRTKLGQWMLGYFAFAWLALQMTDALREIWSWPLGLPRGITLALALGALPTAVVAWYHGEQGRQKVCAVELASICALLVASTWVIWLLCA
jgi:hypothetical protein